MNNLNIVIAIAGLFMLTFVGGYAIYQNISPPDYFSEPRNIIIVVTVISIVLLLLVLSRNNNSKITKKDIIKLNKNIRDAQGIAGIEISRMDDVDEPAGGRSCGHFSSGKYQAMKFGNVSVTSDDKNDHKMSLDDYYKLLL
jgi:hypothetical protein